jgi:hypothetical protein
LNSGPESESDSEPRSTVTVLGRDCTVTAGQLEVCSLPPAQPGGVSDSSHVRVKPKSRASLAGLRPGAAPGGRHATRNHNSSSRTAAHRDLSATLCPAAWPEPVPRPAAGRPCTRSESESGRARANLSVTRKLTRATGPGIATSSPAANHSSESRFSCVTPS